MFAKQWGSRINPGNKDVDIGIREGKGSLFDLRFAIQNIPSMEKWDFVTI